MEFSIRRVNALLKKEIKDISKNANVLFMCVMPLAFAIIYSNVIKGSDMARIDILELCLDMNLTLVSSFTVAMLIAEEKEKNTMRTLMMSGVSPAEFLIGKALMTLLLSMITNIAMFFITGMEAQYILSYIILTTLVAIVMIELGAVVGLLAENQMATGTIGMPVLMVMLLIPILSHINSALVKVAKFIPNYDLSLIMRKIFSNKSMTASDAFSIVVILAWIIIGAIAFGYVYSKKKLD